MFCDLYIMLRRTIGRKYQMNEEMLQALERIFDDNSGSKIESYAKFQAESRSNLSSED